MAKKFEIVKKKNLLTGEVRAVKFAYADSEESKMRILKKLNQSLNGEDGRIFEYRFDESMYMHLLPGLSAQTIKELSSRLYSTAYVVCKKKNDDEKVLYLSLLKDSALRFKAAIPAASRYENGKEVLNPDFYVKELRLCL